MGFIFSLPEKEQKNTKSCGDHHPRPSCIQWFFNEQQVGFLTDLVPLVPVLPLCTHRAQTRVEEGSGLCLWESLFCQVKLHICQHVHSEEPSQKQTFSGPVSHFNASVTLRTFPIFSTLPALLLEVQKTIYMSRPLPGVQVNRSSSEGLPAMSQSSVCLQSSQTQSWNSWSFMGFQLY